MTDTTDIPNRFNSFAFSRVAEWKGDSCDVVAPDAVAADFATPPDSFYWTVYGRGADGLAMALGDFTTRDAARAVAIAISEGRPVTDETGATVETGQYDRETMLEAAACLWEAVQGAQGSGVTYPGLVSYLVGVRAGFRTQGVSAMRGAVIDSAMITALESGYRAAVKEGFDSPFDWEFCPAFVRDCMTWDGALPGLRPDYLDRCKAIGRMDSEHHTVFRSVYFAQGEDAAPDLDRIARDGAAAWLDELSGAVDLFSVDSDATTTPPWGEDDRCEHVETTKAGRVYVHRHAGRLYVSVTTETIE